MEELQNEKKKLSDDCNKCAECIKLIKKAVTKGQTPYQICDKHYKIATKLNKKINAEKEKDRKKLLKQENEKIKILKREQKMQEKERVRIAKEKEEDDLKKKILDCEDLKNVVIDDNILDKIVTVKKKKCNDCELEREKTKKIKEEIEERKRVKELNELIDKKIIYYVIQKDMKYMTLCKDKLLQYNCDIMEEPLNNLNNVICLPYKDVKQLFKDNIINSLKNNIE